MNAHLLEDRCATGNERVDATYDALMKALHCIRDTLATAPGSPKVRQALQLLFQRTRDHFRDEEEAMRAAAYSNLAAHAESHAVILHRLQQIEESVEKRNLMPELALYSLCSDWLSGHRMAHDIEMVEHLRAKEESGPDETSIKERKAVVAVVLDESDTMQNVYSRMLAPFTQKGLRVLYGKNGKEGLEHLRQHRGAAVVIANWDMPVMDGLDLVRTVRKEESLRATPFVMVGIYADAASRRRALTEGATAYILKHLIPYELPPLLERLIPDPG